MVIKLTQEQANYLETFKEDKNLAFHYISRWGYGYKLVDGNEKAYEKYENIFKQSETEKMLNALINGYEIDVPKFKFYNYSVNSHFPLYYAGDFRQLTDKKEEAIKVKKDSEEYKALELLGFYKDEV